MTKVIILLAALLVPFTAARSYAAQMKVFVSEINAAGVPNRDEMKVTLQSLLASRLNGDKILAVGSEAEADSVVTGTYVSIGKIFSVDVIARTPAGKTVARAFVQGETQDELIPAIGKLAEKLSAELLRVNVNVLSDKAKQESPAVALPVTAAQSSAIIVADPYFKADHSGDIVKQRAQEPGSVEGLHNRRLPGAANLMASGAFLSDGSREIFLAEGQRLAYYRQGQDMNLVAEIEFKASDKIISLDTLAVDGALDIYVTIIRSGELASQVLQVKGDKLVLVAENLPFYFRADSIGGGAKKLYVQVIGRSDDFIGDVSEASRNGSAFTLKNPVKMPRYGTIYTFNQFRDRDGKILTAVINPDGYLVVYDQQLNEIWRSNDKFGGSELYFQREDDTNVRVSGEKYRWVFMNQRIQVSSKGEIIVGKNDGFWVLGNARSYKRGAVYSMAWNGSSLEEKWRTRETQNYMPDFIFDEARNELLILQTVQRSGIGTRGASSLSIKKIE